MSEFLPEDPSELPPDRWARMGLTVEGYKEMRAMKLARDANARRRRYGTRLRSGAVGPADPAQAIPSVSPTQGGGLSG